MIGLRRTHEKLKASLTFSNSARPLAPAYCLTSASPALQKLAAGSPATVYVHCLQELAPGAPLRLCMFTFPTSIYVIRGLVECNTAVDY